MFWSSSVGLIFGGLFLMGGAAFLVALLGVLPRLGRGVPVVGSIGACIGSATGLVGAVGFLLREGAPAVDLRLPWSLPVGAIHFGLDALSAFFLAILFLVGFLATLYGHSWMKRYQGRRRLFYPTTLFNLLLVATGLVLLARDGVLFLFVWELMSLATFLLIAYDDRNEEARRAGFLYLVASHVSLVFLMLLFGSLASRGGSFDFSAWVGAPGVAGSSALFVFALLGFGIKAGLWPVHIWLPDTYPPAPPHVASLMSGILLKLGVYGLLRVLPFLAPMQPWWGEVLIVVGVGSALIGVLLALAQTDLTRVCACSSIENLGIIALAMGLGILARAHGLADWATLAFAGALLHTLNHAVIKGVLLQAVGSIGEACGTRRLDALGGLWRRMPRTAFAFVIGAMAIAAVPPLNGFVGEWQIFSAAFHTAEAFRSQATPHVAASGFSLVALAGLALAGGLAVACFIRAIGMVFLGKPRTSAASLAVERPRGEWLAPAIGAGICVILGLFPMVGFRVVAPVARALGGASGPGVVELGAGLGSLTGVALALAALVGGLLLLRHLLLGRRRARVGPVWGCGYPQPSARIQYTAASFSAPALVPFQTLLPRRVALEPPEGYFPAHAQADEAFGDVAGERLVMPAIRRLLDTFGRIRGLQHGHLHLYLLYILATLIALLIWQLAT